MAACAANLLNSLLPCPTRKASPSATFAPSSSLLPCSGQAGTSPLKYAKKSVSLKAESSCAASCTRGASKNGLITSSTTPPTCPSQSSRPKTTSTAVGDGMQQGLSYAETLDVPFAISSNGDAFLVHDRTGQHTPIEAAASTRRLPYAGRTLEALLLLEGHRRPGKTGNSRDTLLRRRQRQNSPLLPSHRHQPHHRGHRTRTAAHSAGHGNWHRQDLHCLPNHLAALEVEEPEKRILFLVGSQHPCRPDPEQRLQAIRPGHDQNHEPRGKQGVRDLPLPLSGRHR
jgi:hypothetical protein